ncbi:MAG: hypothetical protein ACREGB_04240 [Candidatus Saccharimonadales bacterium]
MRNGFDMEAAGSYWRGVQDLFAENLQCRFLPSSRIEAASCLRTYMASEAYALERLNAGTRQKVVEAARKYSAAPDAEAYESAGEYAMYRAAEAKFVTNDLQALWVSLNWPERDVMCGDTPRLYAPESVRTPWLKEEV